MAEVSSRRRQSPLLQEGLEIPCTFTVEGLSRLVQRVRELIRQFMAITTKRTQHILYMQVLTVLIVSCMDNQSTTNSRNFRCTINQRSKNNSRQCPNNQRPPLIQRQYGSRKFSQGPIFTNGQSSKILRSNFRGWTFLGCSSHITCWLYLLLQCTKNL